MRKIDRNFFKYSNKQTKKEEKYRNYLIVKKQTKIKKIEKIYYNNNYNFLL